VRYTLFSPLCFQFILLNFGNPEEFYEYYWVSGSNFERARVLLAECQYYWGALGASPELFFLIFCSQFDLSSHLVFTFFLLF